MGNYLGKEVFKLGFGLMRLPKLKDGSIDIEQTAEMANRFLAAGGTYFDTAHCYDNGESEKALHEAIIKRHPRETFTIADKLNTWQAHDEASAKQQLQNSLERTGAGYFDYYLLHALQRGNYRKYEEYHLWDFLKEQKAKGVLRHIGFSFHADPALLDELLTAHPEVDFIQLQINYADWENPGVASRECYEIARKHGKSLTVMEPVKGGALADPPQGVQDIFRSADPDASMASWAIRYVASMDGIITVLSGMSNLTQMDDNLSYMRDFRLLSDAEQKVIAAAQAELTKDHSIKCTACHYCVEGCPMSIAIPEIFRVKNEEEKKPSWDGGKQAYAIATHDKGKASDCLECGQCEGVCPQHLPIIELLKTCTSMEGE